MRLLLLVSAVCVLGCSSTTVTASPWGSVGGIPFAPVDGFFLESAAPNGDYNLIVFAVDQFNYCGALANNSNSFLANMNVATFTYSNPVGTGPLEPVVGSYPVTLVPGPASSAQVAFQSFNNCVVSPQTPGTSGTVVLSGLGIDGIQLAGSVNVGFTSGSLSGTFSAPFCDLSQSVNGPSTCLPN
jgi:hypothetical protein